MSRNVSARRLASVGAVGVLMALSLSACGSDTDGGNDDGGNNDAAEKKVGVILPDATTSPRWEANDRPSLQAAFDAAGIESIITNADGDVAKFGSTCDAMINEGVQVLMIVNLDSESGAACLKKAADAGVQSIDYDRLTLGGGASYYVSFDNVVVGELMGQGLTQCLDDAGKSKANIVYINGDPTDNNAALFKSGYEQALAAKIDSGDYKLVGDQTGEWDATKAGTAFEQIYAQNKGKVDGVVSANDTMAGGIIARLKANGLAGKVPVTGQDASVEGLQRVLNGTQCMTVYKDTNLEAKAASDLAIALINGDTAAADALVTGTVEDTELGKEVPSVLATPEAIFKDGVAKVIADGFQTKEAVCTGAFAKLCADNGVQYTFVGWARPGPPHEHVRRPTSEQEPVVPATAEAVSTPAPTQPPLLSLRGVNKSFGAVHVLRGVDLDVRPGRVTALVGDNGAGKSTLIKGIAGIHAFDSGEYTFEGNPVTVHSPRDANALGIEVVYQDLALCDNLDVVHNMFLGREATSGGLLDESAMEAKARETLDGLSVRTLKSVRTHVAALSGGQRQTVAIARAVLWNSRIVVLDEPTAALGLAQTEQVLKLVRRLADKGLGVVLISHNLNDVFEVADDIAVLYLGQMVTQLDTASASRNQVVELITTGRSGDLGVPDAGTATGPIPTSDPTTGQEG